MSSRSEVSTVHCSAADVILHMYFIVASSMSIGSILAQIFSARTIVKHLSTGSCTGKAFRVERPVAVCSRGQAFGRRLKPVGYTLSTLGRPTALVGSPDRRVSELLLPLQILWLPSAIGSTRLESYWAEVAVTNFT